MPARNRLQRAQAYVDEAKDLLNLPQWEIKVQDYPSADDAYADIEPHDYLWHAKLRLSEDFWKEKPEDQAKIIAHELLHLHYAGVERIINHLEPILGGQSHEMLSKFWDIEVERAADALSGPVGGLLPQPDFTK